MNSPDHDIRSGPGPATGLGEYVSVWLERVGDEALDPAEEAEKVIADAPSLLKPLLRSEFADLMQFAQSTINRSHLRKGTQVGGYKLVEVIGTGATGTVWEATDDSGSSLALKFLHPAYIASPEGARRVMGEAQLAARVQHPGLVPIVNQIHESELCALVAPMIGTGTTLAGVIIEAREGVSEYNPYTILRALVSAIEGTAALHKAGIFHLDIKPGNLVLGSDGNYVLTDMGLAKVQGEPSMSNSAQILGTPSYMSPEITLDGRKDADARCDVWAWGVTLFETVSLERPFQGAGMHEVLRQIHEDMPTRLNDRSRSLTRKQLSALRSILNRCLEKNPNLRYQNAVELAKDIRNLIDGQRVLGVSTTRQVTLFLQRNRKVALGMTAAGVITIASLFGANYYRSVGRLTSDLTTCLKEAVTLLGEDFDKHQDRFMPLIEDLKTLASTPRLGEPIMRAGLLSMMASSIGEQPHAEIEQWAAVHDLFNQALIILPDHERIERAEVHLQRASLHIQLWEHQASREDLLQAALHLEGASDPILRAKRAWAISHYQRLSHVYAEQQDMDPILASIDAAALLDEAILYLEAEGFHNWSLRCKHAKLKHAIGTRPPTPLDGKAADELAEEFGSVLGPTHSWTIASLSTRGRAWYVIAEDYPQTVHTKETEPDPRRRTVLIQSDRNKYYRYSLEAYQYLLQQTTVRYGANHVFTATAGIGVGQQLMLVGNPEEGRLYYERGIERRSKYAGPNTEILLRIKTGYGVCLMNCGDYEAAVAHYEKHWQDCAAEERLGPGHAITIVAHRGYHHALAVLGRADRIREDSSIQWDSANDNFLSARTLLWEDLQYSVLIELLIGPDPHVVGDIEERWQQLCQSWSDHPHDTRNAKAWKDNWKPQLEESMGILRAVSAGDEAALAACFKENSFFSSDHHLFYLARIQALRLDRVALEETLAIAETGENKHLVDQVRAEIAVLDLNAGDPTSAEDLLNTLTSEEQKRRGLARRFLLWALNRS